MSGGHPFLARQLCSIAYKKHGDTGKISHSVVKHIAHNFVRNPTTASYFDDQGLWGELGRSSIWGDQVSQANHSILQNLAVSSHGLRKSKLNSGPNATIAEQAFIALEERSIISPIEPGSDTYHITFGLFRDWIRLHKS